MTRIDERLAEMLLRDVRGLTPRQCIKRLLESGLIDRRACERQAIRDEVARLQQQGIPRCEALEVAAQTFCCSYGKARNAVYDTFKK